MHAWKLLHGVPHGSILGTVLFSPYMVLETSHTVLLLVKKIYAYWLLKRYVYNKTRKTHITTFLP